MQLNRKQYATILQPVDYTLFFRFDTLFCYIINLIQIRELETHISNKRVLLIVILCRGENLIGCE